MSDYLDTSVIMAALVPEPSTDVVLRWLEEAPAGSLVVSGWVSTELASALSIRLRMGTLTLERRADILAVWRRMQDESLIVDPIDQRHFDLAAHVLDRHDLGLRAGDALHLAIASDRGHRLVTLDRRLGNAALAVGVPVLLP